MIHYTQQLKINCIQDSVNDTHNMILNSIKENMKYYMKKVLKIGQFY